MRKFKIEKEFEVNGLKCVIIAHSAGHRCGYIGLPKDHTLHGTDWEEIEIPVHGGWTYSESSGEYPVPAEGLWWIGFDCAHCDDAKDMELIKELASPEEYSYALKMEQMFPTDPEWNIVVRTMDHVEQHLRKAAMRLSN